MTKCWKIEPKERPTFKQICETLNDMLKDEKVNKRIKYKIVSRLF